MRRRVGEGRMSGSVRVRVEGGKEKGENEWEGWSKVVEKIGKSLV